MTGRLPLPRRRGGSGSCRSACRLLSEAEGRTGALLSDNREALDAVIAALDQETISGDELTQMVGRFRGPAEATPAPARSPSTDSDGTSH